MWLEYIVLRIGSDPIYTKSVIVLWSKLWAQQVSYCQALLTIWVLKSTVFAQKVIDSITFFNVFCNSDTVL